MDGIINILKPPHMTSHDVVSYMRKILKQKKVGHTGTLDPMAAGVLPICIGNATKISQFLLDDTKKYRCEMLLGTNTDTQDIWGKVIRTRDVSITNQIFMMFLIPSKEKITKFLQCIQLLKYKGKNYMN